MVKENIEKKINKEVARLRSEVRSLKDTKSEIRPFTGTATGNYWTATGMPWSSGEGRKAVMTEYFWQPIRGQPRRVDTNELRQFAQTFWVHSCVKTLVDEISSLDWDIVPKDGYEYKWVEEGVKKVKNFLMHPNKNDESFQSGILRPWIKDVLEIDAGVLVKVFDVNSYDFDTFEPKSGAPVLKPIGERNMTEIFCRDGASFLKEMDKFGFIKGYWQYSYQIPAHPMWFDKSEIVYCSESTRSMSCYGYARTQAVMDIVKSLHYSTLYNKRFFEETAIPDGALSLLDTNEDEMKIFMNYWNNEFKAQPHKVAVLNKDIKWQPFAVTNKELEFLETQRWYFNLIISMYGLTPTELGITQDANRAVSATQAELVKRKGIRPFLKLFENFINNEILPEFQTEGIEFQFIYDDPAEKAARLANWQAELNMGVKTINEVRNEMGLEPIAGGDVSNSMQDRITMDGSGKKDGEKEGKEPEKKNDSKKDDRESPGYKDTLKREEADNQKRVKENDKERANKIQSPYSDNNRPNGNFKTFKSAKYETMPLKDLIEEHRKLVEVLEHGTDNELMNEAAEQKKELEEYISKLQGVKKGIDDGQYYRDQPITQPRKLNGAMFQPQNSKPTDTALPSKWTSQTSQANADTDTAPSHVGDSKARPGLDKWNQEYKDKIHCPICGQPTLTVLNSLENLPEDIKCTACGARIETQQLIDNEVLNGISEVLTDYNHSEPVSIPGWSPKGNVEMNMAKQFDEDMDVKSFVGFDFTKSIHHINVYAESPEYQRLLKKYLSDLTKEQRDKIIKILKTGLKSASSIRDISNQIETVIKDERRAMNIAKTEIIRLGSEGNLNRMEEKGTQTVEFISSPEDGRLCKDCKSHDRKIYTLKQAHGMIPLHPKCRCLFTEKYEY